ncbi:MAG: hypothetical protein K0Q96_871 [Rubrobacteraceae bacterium]|nr:hypothetical protein [Rubrobacteraceae bacterium]
MHRRKGRNWGLEEEARRLKQGAHRYRRQEALARRDRLWERDVLVEQLKKEQGIIPYANDCERGFLRATKGVLNAMSFVVMAVLGVAMVLSLVFMMYVLARPWL